MEWLEGAWAARPVAEVGCDGVVLDLGELSDPRVRGCNGGAKCPWRLEEQRRVGSGRSRRPDGVALRFVLEVAVRAEVAQGWRCA